MTMRRIALLTFGLIAAILLLRGMIGAEGLWEAMKPALVPVVAVYLDVFNSPATAILLCLLMIVAAVALFTGYYLQLVAPALNDLAVLATQLRNVERRPGDEAMLGQIERAMSRYPRFARAWQLYRATLVSGADGRWVSRVPPAQYFNMRMLENSGMRLRFFLGLPNDFVGLGLVFTFLGLVAGLYFASRSMMSADLAEARAALIQLLHAATFKFLTSIVGISISIVMAAAQRVMMERVQANLDEVQMLLEEALPLSPHAQGTGGAHQPKSAPTLAVAGGA